ncbi:hypothetical protein Gotur_020422 [Gossypium turneri]
MVRNKEVIDVKFGDLEMEEAATLSTESRDGWDADGVLLNEDDVVIRRDGLYPEICFLERVHDLINKSMEKSIIVRHLRHSIGYRALIGRIQSFPRVGTSQPEGHPFKVVVWVWLSGLPYKYYMKSLMRTIAEVVGKVVNTDCNVMIGKKRAFRVDCYCCRFKQAFDIFYGDQGIHSVHRLRGIAYRLLCMWLP